MGKTIVIGLLLMGVSGVSQAQYQLMGKLIDGSDQQAIPYVSVKLNGKENSISQTNKQGEFIIPKLEPGFYTIFLTHVSYNSKKATLYIDKDTTVYFTLDKTSFLLGNLIVTCIVKKNIIIGFKEVVKSDIEKQNFGQDIPFILNTTPSTVSSSDAGTGIGYTNIRIRGSDASRINVTLNGIPLNDAESQEVFWVNLPDFASSTNTIQLQRGVGNSTNGAGSFGATINMQTDESNEKSYIQSSNTYGSFNTWRNTLKVGTGLLKNHWAVDARLSRISSDGYIDRASSLLKSFFVSSSYRTKTSSVRLNVFSGNEVTYQAWNGVPEDLLATNRTYNAYTYANQTDNYQQDHYQLLYTQAIWKYIKLNIAFHYTKGRGYFEEFKKEDSLKKYMIDPIAINGTTIDKTDLIRRRWLDNNFYGGIFSFFYQAGKINATWGGGLNTYNGNHFGEVIWAQFAGNSSINNRYYNEDAKKIDFNTYLKLNYDIIPRMPLFIDLQIRTVDYLFFGFNEKLDYVPQQDKLLFFNPKTGLAYYIRHNCSLSTSFGVSHREPNRKDYVESSTKSRPQPEILYDWEISFKRTAKENSFSVNYYLMNYENQLVLTGRVNDVGQYTRTNVKKSYRTGVELEGSITVSPRVKLEANATFSTNKIIDFDEYIDNYDTGIQQINSYYKSDIAFSPRLIAAGSISYSPVKALELSLLTKYVGKQYLDNTSSESKKLNPFLINDLRLIYRFSSKSIHEITCGFVINNILNKLYESNGYTYSYIANGDVVKNNFYYPQAGRYFMLNLSISLE